MKKIKIYKKMSASVAKWSLPIVVVEIDENHVNTIGLEAKVGELISTFDLEQDAYNDELCCEVNGTLYEVTYHLLYGIELGEKLKTKVK